MQIAALVLAGVALARTSIRATTTVPLGVCLHGEVDHSSTNLHRFVVSGKERSALFDQNERAKFTLVIFEEELAIFEFDFGVAPRHRDVIDAQIGLMPPSQLELLIVLRGSNDVNNATCVLFLTQRFEDHIIAWRLIVLDQIVGMPLRFHHQRVGTFTDFALEGFPEER